MFHSYFQSRQGLIEVADLHTISSWLDQRDVDRLIARAADQAPPGGPVKVRIVRVDRSHAARIAEGERVEIAPGRRILQRIAEQVGPLPGEIGGRELRRERAAALQDDRAVEPAVTAERLAIALPAAK